MRNGLGGASKPELTDRVRGLNYSRLVLVALAPAAILSLGVGVSRALHGSIDLPWSGAHLVTMHRDPWRTYLTGDPHHEIILAAHPEYLPELYMVLLPLGLTDFSTALRVWLCLNLGLSVASLWLTIKTFDLDALQAHRLGRVTCCVDTPTSGDCFSHRRALRGSPAVEQGR